MGTKAPLVPSLLSLSVLVYEKYKSRSLFMTTAVTHQVGPDNWETTFQGTMRASKRINKENKKICFGSKGSKTRFLFFLSLFAEAWDADRILENFDCSLTFA